MTHKEKQGGKQPDGFISDWPLKASVRWSLVKIRVGGLDWWLNSFGWVHVWMWTAWWLVYNAFQSSCTPAPALHAAFIQRSLLAGRAATSKSPPWSKALFQLSDTGGGDLIFPDDCLSLLCITVKACGLKHFTPGFRDLSLHSEWGLSEHARLRVWEHRQQQQAARCDGDGDHCNCHRCAQAPTWRFWLRLSFLVENLSLWLLPEHLRAGLFSSWLFDPS